MIDLCYQDFDRADVAKAFGLRAGDAAQLAGLAAFVGRLFEAGTVNWRLLDDGSVFRRAVAREAFSADAVIREMIDFVQAAERI